MPTRAPRGFGAKNIFFNTIFPHFEENHIRLAKAFLGSACEQWINTEIFIAVLENNKDQWIRPESSKRDLVFYKSEADEKNCKASLICETKIIYCSEYPSQQTEKLRKLASQIKTGMSELNTTNSIGLIFYFEYGWRKNSSDQWFFPRDSAKNVFVSKKERENIGLLNKFGHSGKYYLPTGEVEFTDYE